MNTYKKPNMPPKKVAQKPINKVRKKKKKLEFSKMLVTWALIMTTVCVVISYGLAMFDHNPAQEVTVAVASACIAIGVAYEAKSYGEKNSRNKYGVDRNGNKIENDEDEGTVG